MKWESTLMRRADLVVCIGKACENGIQLLK